MSDLVPSNAISVKIFDAGTSETTGPERLVCLFCCRDESYVQLTFSLYGDQKTQLIEERFIAEHAKTDLATNAVAEFDLTSNPGRYLYARYIQDPLYRNMPDRVKDLIRHVEKYVLPVVIGPNLSPTLGGCFEASKVRKHLVHTQEFMPVYDELKSILFLVGKGDKQFYVLANCRGNRKVDEKKLSAIIRDNFQLTGKQAKSISIVNSQELLQSFGLEKGRVSPFITQQKIGSRPLVYVFDSDCLRSYGMPMMTNANHSDWATEFVAQDLIRRFQDVYPGRCLTGSIVKGGPSQVLALLGNYYDKVLGTVEYGVEAAMLFRAKLMQSSKDYMLSLTEPTGEDGKTMHLVHAGTFSEVAQYGISSPEFENVMEPDLYADLVKQNLAQTVNNLQKNGCNLIAVPCNILPHYIESCDEIMSITTAVGKALAKQPGQGIMLGGRAVNDACRSIYRSKFGSDIEDRICYLSAKEAQCAETAMMAVNSGAVESANKLIYDILAPHIQDIDFIILASTSLSVMLDKQQALLDSDLWVNSVNQRQVTIINKIKVVDTLAVYADYCASALFEAP